VSGPQGKVEPLTIIDDPADWKAADFQVLQLLAAVTLKAHCPCQPSLPVGAVVSAATCKVLHDTVDLA